MNSINKSSQILLDELDYENKIRQELNEVILYFDYTEGDEGRTELSLITISKNHGERFLFHKTDSYSRLNCLQKMLEYLKSDYKKNYQNYEIIWRKKDERVDNRSWFNGKSFLEVIDKFYYMKDASDILVYSVKQLPLS